MWESRRRMGGLWSGGSTARCTLIPLDLERGAKSLTPLRLQNPPTPSHHLDLVEIHKWQSTKPFTQRNRFPPAPLVNDCVYHFHLQDVSDAATSQILVRAGRDRLLRLLGLSYGGLLVNMLRVRLLQNFLAEISLTLSSPVSRPTSSTSPANQSSLISRCSIMFLDHSTAGARKIMPTSSTVSLL